MSARQEPKFMLGDRVRIAFTARQHAGKYGVVRGLRRPRAAVEGEIIYLIQLDGKRKHATVPEPQLVIEPPAYSARNEDRS